MRPFSCGYTHSPSWSPAAPYYGHSDPTAYPIDTQTAIAGSLGYGMCYEPAMTCEPFAASDGRIARFHFLDLREGERNSRQNYNLNLIFFLLNSANISLIIRPGFVSGVTSCCASDYSRCFRVSHSVWMLPLVEVGRTRSAAMVGVESLTALLSSANDRTSLAIYKTYKLFDLKQNSLSLCFTVAPSGWL